MSTLSEFDEIRPYSGEETRGAINELLADRQFKAVVRGLAPWLPYPVSRALIRLALVGVKSPQDFQMRVMRPVAKAILRRCTDGYKAYGLEKLTWDRRYTFISNHRDIILDISIFNLLLSAGGSPSTCEVAIGDNLLIYPWIKRLVRLNKAFIVRRSLPARELLRSSILMSRYMHFAINEKRENLWIAQREGRAKDSSDRTQEGVIKMLTIGYAEPDPAAALADMNIVPLTISYEYDPCDWLKAWEYQKKRDNPAYKKTRQDDLLNMRTGIFGYKGRVVFRVAGCINGEINRLGEAGHAEFFREVPALIDRHIHSGYELFPNNYIALDLLSGNRDNAAHYTPADERRFAAYLERQLGKITSPDRDGAFLKERILTMYANPLRNYRAATNIND
ncbi:MAG: acyltransferase [Prevotella sp.]|nr:acyltransferase [Prevotella sp.]